MLLPEKSLKGEHIVQNISSLQRKSDKPVQTEEPYIQSILQDTKKKKKIFITVSPFNIYQY